jgi:hypothetical protein
MEIKDLLFCEIEWLVMTEGLSGCQHNFFAIINGNTSTKNLIRRNKIWIRDIASFPYPLAMGWLIASDGIRLDGLWICFRILFTPTEDVYALFNGNYHGFDTSRHRTTINRHVPPLPVVDIHSNEGRDRLVSFKAKSAEYENKASPVKPNKCKTRLA